MHRDISWEAIAGISSSVIALCALAITLWQAYVTREHNKLSVKPYITTWSHNQNQHGFYSVDILNNGVGSALIKRFQIFVDGHEIKGQALELVEKALGILFSNYAYSSYKAYLSEGYMMAPKENRNLVKIQFLGPNFPSPLEIEHATKRVRILIEYESIYKEKQTYDSSKYSVLN